MNQLFFGNSLWHLVAQSDTLTKIVLLILLGMSIGCWTIVLYKTILLKLKRRQLKVCIARLQSVTTMDELGVLAETIRGTLGGYYLTRCLSFVKHHVYDQSKFSYEQVRTELDYHNGHVVDQIVAQEERYLPFLSASGAVSPLLGLFGTVWGIIHSFVRISQKQSADIVTIAPGMAEALITTFAGLLVAIPAVILFHYLNGQVRVIEQDLVSVVHTVDSIVTNVLKGQAKGEHDTVMAQSAAAETVDS